MSARSEIQKLMHETESSGGSLTAQRVVELAKDADRFPALHHHLWEVPIEDLAVEARLARAHRLMITVTVTSEPGVTTRCFVKAADTGGYRPLSTVINNRHFAALRLQELLQNVSRARAQLQAFRATLPADIAIEIDAALEKAEDAIMNGATRRSVVEEA